MSRKVIVIGAGIAGLTAAIYALRSGFDVTLMEQHSIAGGMCTSWKRKGYLFEGAVHWLGGSSPNFIEYHQLWKDTGALNEEVPVFYHDPIRSIEWNGQLIHLYRDIDKTAEHLLKISPEDELRIRQLVKDVKAVSKMPMPVFDIRGVKTQNPKRIGPGFLLKMLPILLLIQGRMGKLTCLEYAGQYAHPGLRQLFRFLADEYAAYSLIITLGAKSCDGGYPQGGSLGMVNRMSKTFTDLGGKLLLNTKVQKVNIQNGAASGVILENGTLNADAVIVTQETIAAMHKLFDTPPQDPWLKKLCKTTKPTLCTFVGVGVRTKLPGHLLPEWKLETPITFAKQTIWELSFNNYCSYEDYAPKGGSALTTNFEIDTYDFWKQAKADGRYEAEKKLLAEQISNALCHKYPQCKGNIEVIDIATPLTYERYTGAYRGSWMGVLRPGDKIGTPYPGFTKNVKGLYFAGHRLMPPGGLPGALSTGRTAAQLVCHQFNMEFK